MNTYLHEANIYLDTFTDLGLTEICVVYF